MAEVTPGQFADEVHREVVADAAHWGVRAHVWQFAALFAGGFVSSLASGGWHVAGWAALGGVLLAAGGAAARVVWPQVRLDAVEAALERVLDAHRAGAVPAPGVVTPTLRAPRAPAGP